MTHIIYLTVASLSLTLLLSLFLSYTHSHTKSTLRFVIIKNKNLVIMALIQMHGNNIPLA